MSASFFNLVAMDSSSRRNSWAGGTTNGKLIRGLRRSNTTDLHLQSSGIDFQFHSLQNPI